MTIGGQARSGGAENFEVLLGNNYRLEMKVLEKRRRFGSKKQLFKDQLEVVRIGLKRKNIEWIGKRILKWKLSDEDKERDS